ncbi:hypothetical protein [Paenibacillus sp. Aloe-11]|uniref:hypothetical protein n=1 Tax=Paenibacillus sp. Aloe-11 TaxID=1050222 RepID=UPI00024EFF90|nr:hypothetical protein [Paenibacillus sp. Aloe-11]EHS59427.1 hypothetical protein WG8_0642 [Paenibacillus sp. Aloe-11]
MTDKQRLIDADKLIKWKDGERSAFYQSLYSSINDGDFDPDPPQQPDIQVGDLVRHKQHSSWHVGKVIAISKKKDKARVEWPSRKGMFADVVDGYCLIDKLQKVEGEEV